jgi:hypothetical protein
VAVTGPELRPRSGTEIVDAAVQLYRRHFRELLALYALMFAPLVLLTVLVTAGGPENPALGGGLIIALGLFGWIFSSLAEAAMAVAVSNSYLHGAPDVAGALRRTLARFGTVLFASLAKWLLIALAFAGVLTATLIPGVIGVALVGRTAGAIGLVILMVAGFLLGGAVSLYLFCRYFAVPAVVVLEGLGVRAALGRSRDLSVDYKRKVALTLALPMLLLAALHLVVSGTLQVVMSSLPTVATLIDQVVGLLIGPIISVIAVLLYYDARIVKEGFDIEMLASDLGAHAGEPAPAPPA